MASASEQTGVDELQSEFAIIPFSIANAIFGAGLLVWVFTMTGHIGRNQGLTIGLLVLTYAMPLMGKFFSALIKGSGRRAPFWVLYIAGGVAAYVAGMALAAAWWTGGVAEPMASDRALERC